MAATCRVPINICTKLLMGLSTRSTCTRFPSNHFLSNPLFIHTPCMYAPVAFGNLRTVQLKLRLFYFVRGTRPQRGYDRCTRTLLFIYITPDHSRTQDPRGRLAEKNFARLQIPTVSSRQICRRKGKVGSWTTRT